MELRWTRKALGNLDQIAAYIGQDNPTRASSFVGEIKEKTELLVAFPALGRLGRVPVTRELVVHENYVVPYRVKGDTVQIIRVQHVARLWPKQFNP
ncbi:type II toxin-antitoxin system RelE/ParE family toxin [Rhodoferax sp. UBA5149]|uniref:type II toxin-antitoxin system RelE/ParE family toxin n=1 Tax=Rhodoferax sp. UBA5149 TaxID=1947379 RepID=UPI0025EB48DF|nr:type II toxin-antitoxin system RelE/ParE family toxin [Rhodoferax sp. UBA5149]